MEIQELLRLLCTQMSVSGSEYTAKKTLFDTFGAYFDEQFETPLGSLIFVRRSARPNAPKLMVDAHFDEVGMLVSEILPDGFLRAANLGGLDAKAMQAGDVIIEISGKAVASVTEIQEMLLKFSKDQVIQVKVMRQGKEEYKEIACSVKLDVLK